MFWDHVVKPKIHLIGIGGSGMSGIAEVLLSLGFQVSGSDVQESATTKKLEKLGARLFKGHAGNQVVDATCVVVSSAVSPLNPEWIEAKKRDIPVIPRAEMLAELMRVKLGVAIAGSHGKTTTTSMVGQILRPLDPTVVVGGRLQHWNASSIVGKGDVFVIEADESDRSFLKFSPVYSLVTNIDREHLDTYRDLKDIENTFADFLNRTAFFGMNWISADCPSLAAIRREVTKPTKTFGLAPDAHLRIMDIVTREKRSVFKLKFEGKSVGSFELPVPGLHNVKNAAGAIGVALSLGMSAKEISEGLLNFIPADRRLQIHHEDRDLALVEDYGHHPTEIEATLDALHQMFPDREIVVFFQPHRFTRTKALWREFPMSFEGRCQHVFLFPIYSAHEDPIPGVTSEAMASEFKSTAVEALPRVLSSEEVWKKLEALPKSSSGRVVLILGAGPLTSLALELRQIMSQNPGGSYSATSAFH
jgi:UDP-N-acetylmuramate--alanine ligase